MKKLYLLVFIAAMFLLHTAKGQVFGHSGATWTFHYPFIAAICFDYYEKWDYTNDTILMGLPAKNIKITSKVGNSFPPNSYTTAYSSRQFRVSGDTVWLFVNTDSSWQEIYNFSVSIGDSVINPLANKLNSWANNCPDSVPYNDYSEVIDTGHAMISSHWLRYYTIRYATGLSWGPDSLNQTFYERLITQNYWYPDDGYWCGAVAECGVPSFVCYRDYDMIVDSACNQLNWFDNLSVQQETPLEWKVYPNPVHDVLIIQSASAELMKYSVLGVDGKFILNGIQSPINVSHLPSGIYFITDESQTWYKKFIKE